MEQENERKDRTFAFFLIGLVVGLVCGYLLNLEKTAQAQAFAFCGNLTEAYNSVVEEYNRCIMKKQDPLSVLNLSSPS